MLGIILNQYQAEWQTMNTFCPVKGILIVDMVRKTEALDLPPLVRGKSCVCNQLIPTVGGIDYTGPETKDEVFLAQTVWPERN